MSVQDGMWVVPSDYACAEPDPLRNLAESIVEQMNDKNAEDVHRIYHRYVESDFLALIPLPPFLPLNFLKYLLLIMLNAKPMNHIFLVHTYISPLYY
jgi:hypothetical protein